MNIFYDKDASLELLRKKQIAVIGYGSQVRGIAVERFSRQGIPVGIKPS